MITIGKLKALAISAVCMVALAPALANADDGRHGRRGHGAYAAQPPGHWKPRHARKWKHRHHRRMVVHHVYPPVQRTVYRHDRTVFGDRILAGGLIGAAVGALAGSQIGKGGGRTVAIVGGAVLGAVIGGNIGRDMDRSDQATATRVLETGHTGTAVEWHNPESGYRYTVTPTRTYQNAAGQYCREYTTWGWIGGYEEQLHGTACRMPDGSWKQVG